MMNLNHFEPVTKSDHCKLCKSTTVTWRQIGGAWKLAEIFMLEGEEVANHSDVRTLHYNFCVNPLRPHKAGYSPSNARAKMQDEINDAAAASWDDEDESWYEASEGGSSKRPKSSEDDEIKTDGHPYICVSCGAGIITGLDGLDYDFNNDQTEKLHTCDFTDTNPLVYARRRGAKAAKRVKFEAISERMDTVEAALRNQKEGTGNLPNSDGNQSTTDEICAALGAEYLVLRKRLWTEFPS